jgi:hypothetical protein
MPYSVALRGENPWLTRSGSPRGHSVTVDFVITPRSQTGTESGIRENTNSRQPGAVGVSAWLLRRHPSTVPVNGTLAMIMLLSDKQDNFDHGCRVPAGVVVLASVAVSQAGPRTPAPPRRTIGRQSGQRASRGQGTSAAVVRQIVSGAPTAVSQDFFPLPPRSNLTGIGGSARDCGPFLACED